MKVRKILLKKFSDKQDDNYQALLLNVLRAPKDPRAGTQFAEVEKLMPIINTVKEVHMSLSGGHLLLSEDEWTVVKDKVTSFPFGANDENVYNFCKAFIDAEQVLAEEKSTKKSSK